VEAGLFGVPVLFLSEDAHGPFGDLMARHEASVIAPDRLRAAIAGLPKRPVRPAHPDEEIEAMASASS
jgi:hypothetical protein